MICIPCAEKRHQDCTGCPCQHRPRALDLFCGSFGAGYGYLLAGYDVTGVDLVERPRPAGVTFVQADALAFLRDNWQDYDLIHASPPCRDWTSLAHRVGMDGTAYLLDDTLTLLRELPVPWVVENVESAPMPGALILCGTEFGLRSGDRWLRRHRRFLSSEFLYGAGGCSCSGRLIGGVYGTGGGGAMTRGYKLDLTRAREAMQMPWADRESVSLAIPPAYTRFIGEQLLDRALAA